MENSEKLGKSENPDRVKKLEVLLEEALTVIAAIGLTSARHIPVAIREQAMNVSIKIKEQLGYFEDLENEEDDSATMGGGDPKNNYSCAECLGVYGVIDPNNSSCSHFPNGRPRA